MFYWIKPLFKNWMFEISYQKIEHFRWLKKDIQVRSISDETVFDLTLTTTYAIHFVNKGPSFRNRG